VDRALSTRIDDAREALSNMVVDSLAAYRATHSSTSGALMCPEALRLLPLQICALLKNVS
jgi:hypothetical protein